MFGTRSCQHFVLFINWHTAFKRLPIPILMCDLVHVNVTTYAVVDIQIQGPVLMFSKKRKRALISFFIFFYQNDGDL